jgi:hypothetical protein
LQAAKHGLRRHPVAGDSGATARQQQQQKYGKPAVPHETPIDQILSTPITISNYASFAGKAQRLSLPASLQPGESGWRDICLTSGPTAAI